MCLHYSIFLIRIKLFENRDIEKEQKMKLNTG